MLMQELCDIWSRYPMWRAFCNLRTTDLVHALIVVPQSYIDWSIQHGWEPTSHNGATHAFGARQKRWWCFDTAGHFHFLDQSFTETKRISFGLSPELRLTNQLQLVIADIIGDSSLISPCFVIYFWISEKVKKNWSFIFELELLGILKNFYANFYAYLLANCSSQ